MKEDIQNHSPTVMFRGTPCKKTGRLNKSEFKSNLLTDKEQDFLK